MMNILGCRRMASVAIMAAALAACGGGGGGGGGAGGGVWASGPAVSGSAVKGPLEGATVCVFKLEGGAKGTALPVTAAPALGGSGSVNGGCYVTGADGRYAFTLPLGTTGDVLVESSGGRFCTDESPVTAGACTGGMLVALQPGDMLRAVVAVQPTAVAQVHLTPLSTAAVGAAGQALTSTNFEMQFGALAAQLGVDPAQVTASTPPTAANQPYLAQAAQQIAAGGSLALVVQGIQQNTGAGTGGGATSPATVNAALVGSYTLRFHVEGGDGCGSSCSYVDGQDVAVEVFADGRLGLPHKVLTNPFYRSYSADGAPHLPEIIWLDADAQVEYALSNNESGSFNEINVGDASQPQGPLGTPRFLGQLRKAEADGGSLLSALAATYAKAYQYQGADVTWSSVTIGADGAVTFDGTGPSVTAAQVAEIVGRTECCGRIDVLLNFDFTGDGAVDGTDKISLFVDAAGNLQDLEYQATPSYANRTGVRVTPAEALPVHGGSIAMPTGNAVAAVVDGADVSIDATGSNALTGNTVQASLTAVEVDANNQLLRQWSVRISAPTGLVQGQTYACRRGTGSSTDTAISFQPQGSQVYGSEFGGRCSITITQLVVASGQVNEIAGTFVAELGDNRHQLKVVRDGVFHFLRQP